MYRPTLTFIAVLLAILLPVSLFASSYDPLLPLLVDLPGWEANDAEGYDMSDADNRVVMVYRSYTDDERSLEVTILMGSQAAEAWLPTYKEGFKVESAGSSMEVTRINGFLVYRGFDSEDQSTGILVLLQEAPAKANLGAVLMLSAEGVPLEEALKLAQKFDWKRMKEQIAKL